MCSTVLTTLVAVWMTWTMTSFGVEGCYDNTTSWGFTTPPGDINHYVGQDLSITCTITDNSTEPTPDSTRIFWQLKRGGSINVVPSSYVTILDHRSARLDIRNLTLGQSGIYQCILNITEMTVTMCINVVNVGNPLPPSVDFSCLAQQRQSMVCSWNPPPGRFLTDWTLELQRGNTMQVCPKYEMTDREKTSCFYSRTGDMPYDSVSRQLKFTLKGKTAIDERKYEYRVEHHKYVVAAPPENLAVTSSGSTGLKVSWTVEQDFSLFLRYSAVVYRIEYRSQWDPPDIWKHVNANQTSFKKEEMVLKGLLPYSKYEIIVRCKSASAASIEKMWSRGVRKTGTTTATAPVDSVETIFSGFEGVNVNNRRNITIYWKPMPQSQYYGPDFHYNIEVVDDPVIVARANVSESQFTVTFSKLYQDKSYKFVIRAGNSKGYAVQTNEITVPASSSKPAIPKQFTATYDKDRKYILSWKYPPVIGSTPTSNTVFWCKEDPTKVVQCLSALHWQPTGENITDFIVTVSDSTVKYRFAVSSDNPPRSSGLVWSKCIASPNGGVSKVTMLTLENVDPRQIRATWRLDCDYRTGTLEGFVINYCPYSNIIGDCSGTKKQAVVPYTTESFAIIGLTPFTTYGVTVSVKSNGTVGEASDQFTITTGRAAPWNPPTGISIGSVTDRSFTVAWISRVHPNDRLTRFLVTYSDQSTNKQRERVVNVDPSAVNSIDDLNVSYVTNITDHVIGFSRYSVTLSACNELGCSAPSDSVLVSTDIGVPGETRAPTVALINQTHVLVRWESPSEKNGPLRNWRLRIGPKENNVTRYVDLNDTHQYSVSLECVDGPIEYTFAVSAVNYRVDLELRGPWSNETVFNVCVFPPGLLPLHVAFVALGSGSVAIIVVIFLRYRAKGLIRKFQDMRKVKVDLPLGLVRDISTADIGFSKNGADLKSRQHGNVSATPNYYGRLQSISSDEGRASMDSDDLSLQRGSSLDSIRDENYSRELSLHVRNNSGDSSGCCSGDGSVSSCVTTRTSLPSDPGTPTSPGSVFMIDFPWTPTVTAAPPAATTRSSLRLRSTLGMQRCDEERDTDPEVTSSLPDATSNRYCKIAVSDNATTGRASEVAPTGSNVTSASEYSKFGVATGSGGRGEAHAGSGNSVVAFATVLPSEVPKSAAKSLAREKPEVKPVTRKEQTYVDISALVNTSSDDDVSNNSLRVGYSKLARPDTLDLNGETTSGQATTVGAVSGGLVPANDTLGGGSMECEVGPTGNGNAGCGYSSAINFDRHRTVDMYQDLSVGPNQKAESQSGSVSDNPRSDGGLSKMAADRNNSYLPFVLVDGGGGKGDYISFKSMPAPSDVVSLDAVCPELGSGETSWEGELENSEDNVNDEDLARMVAGLESRREENAPPPRSSEGYVQISTTSEFC